MEIVQSILQVVVALGILNVWLLRGGKPTAYRGGGARNLRAEFANYGLPPVAMYVVGVLKVGCALGLLIGLWVQSWVDPSAAGLAVLMIGALGMHLKIGDPLIRSVPAAALLVLCGLILAL